MVRSLHNTGSYRVLGVDSDGRTAGLWRTPVSYVVPFRKDSDVLLSVLQEIIAKERVQLLLPLSTEDQSFYSNEKIKDALAPVVTGIGSSLSIAIASDKLRTYQALNGVVPLPDFTVVQSVQKLQDAVSKYSADGLTCVVKRPVGTGSQGVKVVRPGCKAYEDIWRIDGTVVYADDFCSDLDRCGLDERLMVTDFLPGRHVSVDCFRRDDGDFVGIAREEWNTSHGVGVGGRIIDCREAIAIAKAASERIGLTYAFNVELKEDSTGRLKLLEINPRMGASVGLSIRAGYDFPLMQAEYAMGRPSFRPKAVDSLEVRRTVERLYASTSR